MATSIRKDGTRQAQGRSWVFIGYPSNALLDMLQPDSPFNGQMTDGLEIGWESKFSEAMHYASWVCIFHGFDLNEDGSPKKPHFHIIVTFPSTKTMNQIQLMLTDFIQNLAPLSEKNSIVANLPGKTRYLTHMDNPEKYQYSHSDVKIYNGFDYDGQIVKSVTDEIQIETEMMDYIAQYHITEYFQFAIICRYNHPTWYRRLRTNSLHFREFIKSCRHSSFKDIVDPETGEVLVKAEVIDIDKPKEEQ